MKEKLTRFSKKVINNYSYFLGACIGFAIMLPFMVPVVKALLIWTLWLWKFFNFK